MAAIHTTIPFPLALAWEGDEVGSRSGVRYAPVVAVGVAVLLPLRICTI